MRFSHSTLPPSEYIDTDAKLAELCKYMLESTGPYGFDTETDGLGYKNLVEQTKVAANGSIKRKKKVVMAGDGLGASCEVLCIAFPHRRVAVPIFEEFSRFLEPMADVLLRTQHRHAGWNWIFDANVMESNVGRSDWELTNMFGDGFVLMHHWDEDAEDTNRERGLKARARTYLGLPMNDFDQFLVKGIRAALKDPATHLQALDYCTRDAYAHLGMMLRSMQIAKQMPWCIRCPHCQRPAMQRHAENDSHYCPEHGWVRGDQWLTIWDWHQMLDIPFLVLLKRMEQRGVLLDEGPLRAAVAPLQEHLQGLRKQFQAEVGSALKAVGGIPWEVSLTSPAQLVKLYYGSTDATGARVGLGLPVGRRGKKGNASAQVKELKKLGVTHNAPGVMTLTEASKIAKVLGTYVQGLSALRWSKTGRLHTTLRPGTATGRLSSRYPNLQNSPRDDLHVTLAPTNPLASSVKTPLELAEAWGCALEEAEEVMSSDPSWQPSKVSISIRDAFVAPEGKVLVCADYEQLEVKLTAIESRDPRLCKVINEGLDLHCYTASKAFGNKYAGMTYESLNETQQSKDGNYTYRVARMVKYIVQGESAFPDFAAVLDSPHVKAPTAKVTAAREALPALAAEFQAKLAGTGIFEEIVSAGYVLDRELMPIVELALGKQFLKQMSALVGVRDDLNKICRTGAKSVMFGCIYGIGPVGLAVNITEQTGQPVTPEEAKALIEAIVYQEFEEVGKMILRQKQAVTTRGHVRTLMGRYRTPMGAWSADSAQRARAGRQANNSPIQGLAMDITRVVMLAIEHDPIMIQLGGVLLMQVHDELLMEFPEENGQLGCERLQYLMSHAHGLCTPVPLTATAHYAKSWGKAK